MTLEQQQECFIQLVKKLEGILFRKGGDYSVESDRLSNFKYAGTICGLTAEQNCLSLIATKVARLGVLLRAGKAPNNESVEDSVDDLINYGILLKMLLDDRAVALHKESEPNFTHHLNSFK